MATRKIFFIIMFIFIPVSMPAQLSQEDRLLKEMTTPVLIQKQYYDSLSNCAGDNTGKYINQILIPMNTYNREIYGFGGLTIEPIIKTLQATDKNLVYKRLKDTYYSDFNKIEDMRFLVTKSLKFDKNYPKSTYLELTNQYGDTIYYKYPDHCHNFDDTFLVLGHYEKIKSLLVGNSYVYNIDYKHSDDKYHGIRDSETREELPVKKGDIWTCINIGLSKTNDGILVALLENSNNKNGVVPIRDILFGVTKETSKFIAKKEYELDIKKAEDEKKLILKIYGKQVSNLIAKGEVRIGWSKQMCLLAWGKPEDINKTTTKYGVSEQWVYKNNSYLYFENGKLTTIQN